jgi:hypothetical protein
MRLTRNGGGYETIINGRVFSIEKSPIKGWNVTRGTVTLMSRSSLKEIREDLEWVNRLYGLANKEETNG